MQLRCVPGCTQSAFIIGSRFSHGGLQAVGCGELKAALRAAPGEQCRDLFTHGRQLFRGLGGAVRVGQRNGFNAGHGAERGRDQIRALCAAANHKQPL